MRTEYQLAVFVNGTEMAEEKAGNRSGNQCGNERAFTDSFDTAEITVRKNRGENNKDYVIGGLYTSKINMKMA